MRTALHGLRCNALLDSLLDSSTISRLPSSGDLVGMAGNDAPSPFSPQPDFRIAAVRRLPVFYYGLSPHHDCRICMDAQGLNLSFIGGVLDSAAAHRFQHLLFIQNSVEGISHNKVLGEEALQCGNVAAKKGFAGLIV